LDPEILQTQQSLPAALSWSEPVDRSQLTTRYLNTMSE